MKRLLLVTICIVLLATGCVEQKDAGGKDTTKATGESMEKLILTVTSPRAGEILQGNNDVNFDASVSGGKGPYTYRWSSNIDGTLSAKKSYRQTPSKLSKGEHNLILEVIDASGRSTQASVIIQVM
ncbi:MAG: PKD domain-containing protein [Methanothrix sp.]|nr:PKD domain-containing protein [Methanothrix sp.]